MRLLQKSLFVIPEVFIGNPESFKNKDFWIPVFTGMTAKAICLILLQEALIFKKTAIKLFLEYMLSIHFHRLKTL